MAETTFAFGPDLTEADTSQHLLDAIFNGLLFASSNDDLPSLEGVRFEYRPLGDRAGLTLVATDRYALSMQTIRTAANGEGGPLDFMVGTGDLKAMLTAHRKARYLYLMVDREAFTLRVKGDVTTEHELMANNFPKWERLFPGVDAVAQAGMAFRPQFLAKLGKVRRRGVKRSDLAPVELTFYGDRKPAVARMDAGPTVLIMPVRTS